MEKLHLDIVTLPSYPEPYATLLAMLQNARKEWLEELEEPSPEAIVWQPYPNGHSIGSILLHIASAEAYWIEMVCLGRELDPERGKRLMSGEIDAWNGIWPTPPLEPLSYYLALMDEVRTQTLESVKSFGSAEALVENDWGIFTLKFVLTHLISHDSYHGGQAVLLSRMWTANSS